MLVLSRKPGEVIRIAGAVELTVLEIRKGRVKLGIASPPHIPIRRGELNLKSIDPRADPNDAPRP